MSAFDFLLFYSKSNYTPLFIIPRDDTDHSGWVSLALALLTGPMMDFQWAIALLHASIKATMGPELMKAVKLGKKCFPYSSA